MYYMTAVVRSLTEVSHSSTASVTVYVADKNDNAPVISWPSQSNNTIYISDQIDIDVVIARIQATDEDLGGNGKLGYTIEDDYDDIFDMGIGSGVLTIKKDISDMTYDSFDLHVIVNDHGFPERVARSSLHVIVNSTRTSKPDDKGPVHVIHTNNNTTIIVSLTSASLVLIFLLIVAIILVKKQQQEKKAQTYSNEIQPKLTNGRTEAQNMLAMREDTADGRESVNSDWSGVRGQHNLASSATMESCYQQCKDNNHSARLSIDDNDVNIQVEQCAPHAKYDHTIQVSYIDYFH